MMSTKKSSTITFRIDQEIDIALRSLAEEKKISLNTLANQILGNYLQLELYMEKFGVLMMSKDTFRILLSTIDEKDLIKVALEAGSSEPKEFILFKWKEINSDIVTKFIKIYLDHCGYGTCDIAKKGSKITVSIIHSLGKKGSIYIKFFLESLIRSTLDKSCETVTNKELLSLTFTE